MSNDNLRDKTNEFKERIINQTNDLKQEIKNIEIEIQKTDDLNQKEILYQKIDEIENTLQQKISTTLDKILPEDLRTEDINSRVVVFPAEPVTAITGLESVRR